MKLKVLSALLGSAFLGVATTASAGVIQASFKNYAAEVFGTNAVNLTAPTVNYALALPLSGTVANPNTFTIRWTLLDGAKFVPASVAVGDITLSDPANALTINPTTVTLESSDTVLAATFTVTNNYTVGSQIVLGGGGPIEITSVGTVLGSPMQNACSPTTAQARIAVRLTNAAGAEFDSNFTLAPLNNTTPIAQSTVALSVTARDSATFGTPLASREASRVDVLSPSLGRFFTNEADVTASTSIINLGSIVIADRSALFDLNGTDIYSSKGPNFGTAPGPLDNAGIVAANTLRVDVGGLFQTTANGGAFFASLSADCTTTLEAGTIATNGASATVTLTNADLIAAAGVGPTDPVLPIYMCYSSTNANVIPVSQFSVTGGTLSKFATSLEAANPVCPGNIYNLISNGVRVDVRNYLPSVVQAASGWYSVVRVINTDEAQTVVPVAQALLASGTLGASVNLSTVPSVDGKTGAFAPREVRYYTSMAIDAALGAAANGAVYGPADVGGNARLRITAPSSSIRVQNYVFNAGNGNFIEASSAQGDDGSVNAAAPTIADLIRSISDSKNR